MSYDVWRITHTIQRSGAVNFFEMRFDFASKHYLTYHPVQFGVELTSIGVDLRECQSASAQPSCFGVSLQTCQLRAEMFTLAPCFWWLLNYSFYSVNPWDYPVFICCFIPMIHIWYLYAPNGICYFQYWLVDRQVQWAVATGKIPSPMSASSPFCADLDT